MPVTSPACIAVKDAHQLWAKEGRISELLKSCCQLWEPATLGTGIGGGHSCGQEHFVF